MLISELKETGISRQPIKKIKYLFCVSMTIVALSGTCVSETNELLVAANPSMILSTIVV